MSISRRRLLAGILGGAAATAGGAGLWRRRANAGQGPAKKFLITVGAFGGASITDSFMAVSEDDLTAEQAAVVNAYPAAEIANFAGSPFRAVNRSANLFGESHVGDQSAFVSAHRDEMLVVTQTGTSVNHTIAQQRSITGNGAWNGRTLQEAIAVQHGDELPLPNVTMGSLGFRADGLDPTTPPEAYAASVADPQRWPLGLDGIEGIEGHPDREIVELARSVRSEELDPQSRFWQTFQLSERLERWKAQRDDEMPAIEQAELLRKLNFGSIHESLPAFDQADLAALETAFLNISFDPLAQQAAMAYLLVKHGVSCAVTVSPNWNLVTNPDSETNGFNRITSPPLSFDYSHTSHRTSQQIMWKRTLDTVDGLISLLRDAPHPFEPGDSCWDHTLIYVATDFGRTKNRPDGATGFGTGHHLNNGNLLLGHGLRGNTVLGGVDPVTGLTYGFNPQSGTATPGVEMKEDVIYAGILDALAVDHAGSGLPSVPAMLG